MLKSCFTLLLILMIGLALPAQCDFVVPINPNPEVPGNVYCSYEEVELKTSQFESYQWEYKFFGSSSTWTEMTGETNQSLFINAGEWAGTYFRVNITQDTCTGTSDSILIDGWVFVPPFIIQESPETQFCIGDSTKLEAGGPTFDSIQWLRDFEPIPGANDPIYWVKESGYYVLQGSPTLCPELFLNSGVGPTFEFTGPEVPSISPSGDTLFASSGPNFQWLLDGQPIGGATEDYWIPQANGDYSVEVSDGSGCSATSEVFPVLVNAVQDIELIHNIRLSPNPVTDLLILHSDEIEPLQVHILDIYGRTVVAPQPLLRQLPIDLSTLAKGLYFARVETLGRFAIFKVMKR